MATNTRYCPKCGKTLAEINFYTLKSGEKSDLCKACETMHINNWEPDTYLWLLRKYDVPYIPAEWDVLRDRAYQKDPYKMNGMSVFGKYLSKMKLRQWKEYGWDDTERLQQEAEEKAKEQGIPTHIEEEKIEQMKQAYENGEITKAQLDTYIGIKTQPPAVEEPAPPPMKPMGPGFGSPYPMNRHPYEEVELVDVGAELTHEDKIYLATKWGVLYTAAQWVQMEQLYNNFKKSFAIEDAAREDTLKIICKTSLKMNEAIDSGDVDSYQKLSRSYDSLLKSGKFSEAQKKEEAGSDFDAVGCIVSFCEREGGFIPRDLGYKIAPRDIIDTIISDMKQYNKTLIYNDPGLAQQIEQYIKKKEIAEQQKKDKADAKARGLEEVDITDDDMEARFDQVDEELTEDEKFFKEVQV